MASKMLYIFSKQEDKMINIKLGGKNRQTVLSGLSAVLVMALILTLLMITGFLFASNMDDRIESTAKKSYVFKTFLKSDDIQIHSQDGIVSLTGTVASEAHLLLAAETVADLPGVKSVANKLEVAGGIPEKNSDAWIRLSVKNMLLLHRNLDASNTQIDVKDGQVTLQGEASSQAAKALTTEYIKDVEGVTEVYNKMTVWTTAKTKQKLVEEFIDDASIKAQIKLALLFHRGTNPLRADITVKNGAVSVVGTAKNAAEKELIGKRIEDIPGVISIDNRMNIE
jgi:hyperosmotically inducible protein